MIRMMNYFAEHLVHGNLFGDSALQVGLEDSKVQGRFHPESRH
jgi:hypothetical protein